MSAKFKIGDVVIPRMPSDKPDYTLKIYSVGFAFGMMNGYCNEQQTITASEFIKPDRQREGGWCYKLQCDNGYWNWCESWLEPVDYESNQYNKTCKWCKDSKIIQKRVESVDFIFNYCPRCGR